MTIWDAQAVEEALQVFLDHPDPCLYYNIALAQLERLGMPRTVAISTLEHAQALLGLMYEADQWVKENRPVLQ